VALGSSFCWACSALTGASGSIRVSRSRDCRIGLAVREKDWMELVLLLVSIRSRDGMGGGTGASAWIRWRHGCYVLPQARTEEGEARMLLLASMKKGEGRFGCKSITTDNGRLNICFADAKPCGGVLLVARHEPCDGDGASVDRGMALCRCVRMA
jgi:hypothetical protein